MDKNIEPIIERKDVYLHSENAASPSLKENTLQVETNNRGPITVPANSNEGRGLGTGLFGSTKVTPSYFF